jgi:serine/threonine protein phosphatase 1
MNGEECRGKFLKGNHEQMFWEGYYSLPEESKSKWFKSAREIWFDNGGRITVEKLRESGRMDELNREWIRFIEKLPLCAEMTVAGKTFWFMHADCEPMLPLVEQIPHVLLWGRSLAKYPELNQGETVIPTIRSMGDVKDDKSFFGLFGWNKGYLF